MLTIQEAVRKRIEPLMIEHNYNISELARRSDLPQSTVNDIVKGKVRNPSLQAIYQIAEAFGLEISEFLSHELFKSIKIEPMKSNR